MNFYDNDYGADDGDEPMNHSTNIDSTIDVPEVPITSKIITSSSAVSVNGAIDHQNNQRSTNSGLLPEG
jgi:hypothetical protein